MPIKDIKVKEIMQEPLLTVNPQKPIQTISQLLANNQAIKIENNCFNHQKNHAETF